MNMGLLKYSLIFDYEIDYEIASTSKDFQNFSVCGSTPNIFSMILENLGNNC